MRCVGTISPLQGFFEFDNAVYEDPLPVEFMEAMHDTYWFSGQC